MTNDTLTERFPIKNRFSGEVIFTAEISVTPDMLPSVKLGLAIRAAVKKGAYLAGAYLADADLAGADLAGAYLTGAYLARANLAGAYLAGAYLAYADLAGADLAGADLAGAYLAGAYLADAKGADLAIARTRILPDGDLIGWKKCRRDVIVKLLIPKDSPRSHAFWRKCRAKFADVLEVIGGEEGVSYHDEKTTYRVGERVECDRWDEDWQNECSGGIHFYISRLEAEAH